MRLSRGDESRFCNTANVSLKVNDSVLHGFAASLCRRRIQDSEDILHTKKPAGYPAGIIETESSLEQVVAEAQAQHLFPLHFVYLFFVVAHLKEQIRADQAEEFGCKSVFPHHVRGFPVIGGQVVFF